MCQFAHMKNDISSRADIELLVDTFYKKLLADELIGFFFTKVVVLDWDLHMPTMYNFWEGILLDVHNYQGNPMLKHMALDKKAKMEPIHFQRWLSHWEVSVYQLFEGSVANEAIKRAKQIGDLMQYKVEQDR